MKRMGSILIQNLLKLIQLNLLFIVFSIPIITIPAAFSSLTRGVWSVIEEEDEKTLYLFLKRMRSNFFQATSYGIISVLFGLGIIFSIRFYGNVMRESLFSAVLLAISLFLFIIYLGVSLLINLILSTVSLSFLAIFKNAIVLFFANIGKIIVVTLCASFLVLISVMYLPYSLPVAMLISFSITNYFVVYFIGPMIKKRIIHG